MYLCRAALQRFSPLIKSSITPRTILHRDVVPRRFMSSVPGGTGENLVYLVLCGGALVGSLTYAYRTVMSDSARFTERMKEIEARPKNDWKPKTWTPKNAEEATDVAEEEVEQSTEPLAEAPTEPPAGEPTEPPAEAATERTTAATMEVMAQIDAEITGPVVETAAEAVTVATKRADEVDSVFEETAEEVTAVVQQVEKMMEKVEAAPVVKETHGTEAVTKEEVVTESANKEA